MNLRRYPSVVERSENQAGPWLRHEQRRLARHPGPRTRHRRDVAGRRCTQEQGHARPVDRGHDRPAPGVAAGGGIVHSMGNNMIVSNDIDISGAINFTTFVAR